MNNVLRLSFDGASNMAGKENGVQALMIKNHTKDAIYIHCRSHALQLVGVNAAQKYPDIRKMFSVLSSLWRLLYNSPKNLRKFKAIQDLLIDNMEACMMVSMEGPEKLTDEEARDVVQK